MSSKPSTRTAEQRFVDMWAMPGLHPTNNQFLQRLKSADSSQFTRNMQVIGTASTRDASTRKWDKSHLIGIRTDVWQPTQKEVVESLESLREKRTEELRREIKRAGRLSATQSQKLTEKIENDHVMQVETGDLESRRLVLKLFSTNGNRTNWCGTLEQVTTTEIHNSIGSNRALITMAIMLPRINTVTMIQENHKTMRFPPVFSFCFFENQKMHYGVLSKRMISFGPDFDVKVDNLPAGLINGRLFSFGCDSSIELAGPEIVADTQFVDMLTLFAASMGYHRAMRHSINRRVAAVKAGRSFQHLIEDEEIRLHHNGRSAA